MREMFHNLKRNLQMLYYSHMIPQVCHDCGDVSSQVDENLSPSKETCTVMSKKRKLVFY